MSGACSVHARNEKCVKNLIEKREGKSPLGRLRHKWQDNIKMDVWERGL
jgi:hypothetical protein